ncbi:MAG: tripartite tricarboxylate transporter substrate binding protein [Betaproteobacteria bacterium]|nr:tripartite tricarboxylate transporter substrate binding protein [Betaproteobacteria bacterium]
MRYLQRPGTRSFFAAALLSVVAQCVPLCASAQAQSWPSRPIRFIVPLPPGGSNDILARLFAERLQVSLKQPVVVENRPGVGGNIGTEYVAKQPADGYTILLSSNTHVVNVSFFAKLPYDPIKDFEAVSLAATLPFVLTVNSSLPVNNVNELLGFLKAKPGSPFGTSGIGTPHHLAVELLKSMTGIDVTHVPYKGAAFLVPALLASEVVFSIAAVNSLLPHYKSGKLRALAVATAARVSLLPDVPTMAEVGLPGYNIDIWLGVLAPAGTPRPIVERLNTELNRVMRDPQIVREKLNPIGLSPIGSTPEQFQEVMKADLVKYAKITRDAGIKPE